MKVYGLRLLLIYFILIYLVSCSLSKSYTIEKGDYSIVKVDNLSVRYFGDYAFHMPTKNDIFRVKELISKIPNRRIIWEKSKILFICKTIVPPFYEDFLVKLKRQKNNIQTDSLMQKIDSNNAIFFYIIKDGEYNYIFIHHNIKIERVDGIYSNMSRNEFSFIMKSIKFKY